MAHTFSLYPMFAQVHDRNVLVVGGGVVAERKVRALLQAGARVSVGAPTVSPQLERWVEQSRITWLTGSFEPHWLDNVWLVIAATDNAKVNAQIQTAAEERRIWANVVDDPMRSSFQVPAMIDRAPVCIAVSSGGAAPMLARRLRERIEALVDHHVGPLASMLAQHRQAIAAAYPDLGARRDFYDRVYDGQVHQLIKQGDTAKAQAVLAHQLQHPEAQATRSAITVVQLLDHDPGSITLDGLRALNTADALVYDESSQLSHSIIDLARRDADRYFFKSAHTPEMFSALLNDVLARYRRVVVLCESSKTVDALESAIASSFYKNVAYQVLHSGRRQHMRTASAKD